MFRFALHATRKMSRFVCTVLSSVISTRSWNINVSVSRQIADIFANHENSFYQEEKEKKYKIELERLFFATEAGFCEYRLRANRKQSLHGTRKNTENYCNQVITFR